jgi:hypothetical protein
LTLEIDTKLKSFLSFNKNQDKNDGPMAARKQKQSKTLIIVRKDYLLYLFCRFLNNTLIPVMDGTMSMEQNDRTKAQTKETRFH